MNRKLLSMAILITALLSSHTVLAGGAVTHSVQASAHSAQASGHAVVSGAKFVSGSAAVPLTLSGGTGTFSAAAGNKLWESADTPIGDPLPVTDKTYLVGPPPDRAMQQTEVP